MKPVTFVVALLLSTAPLAMALGASHGAPGSVAGQAGAEALAEPDTTFLPEAIQGGMAEVELGRLAAEKGSGAEVKQFGQKMVEDHSAANKKLMAIAEKHQIEQAGTKGTPPLSLSEKAAATKRELSQLSGKEFDRAYMRAMVADHETAVTAFRAEAKDGKNAELRGLAEELLPALEGHLRMARALAEQVQAAR